MKAVIEFITKPGTSTFKRLVERLCYRGKNVSRKISLAFQRTSQQTEYCGFVVHFTKGDTVIQKMRDHGGEYEPDINELIQRHLRRNDRDPVLVDIGANIGLVSLYQIAKCPEAKVFAFEPGPHQGDLLAQTIASNRLSGRIQLERFALGETDGEMDFHIHGSEDSSGDGFIDIGWAGPTSKIRVKVRTLDSWWQENQCPGIDVMKIDTEGAESQLVLRGGKECLSATRPNVVLEIAEVNIANYSHEAADVFRFFSELDYQLCDLDEAPIPEDGFQDALSASNNFTAVPRERLPNAN